MDDKDSQEENTGAGTPAVVGRFILFRQECVISRRAGIRTNTCANDGASREADEHAICGRPIDL